MRIPVGEGQEEASGCLMSPTGHPGSDSCLTGVPLLLVSGGSGVIIPGDGDSLDLGTTEQGSVCSSYSLSETLLPKPNLDLINTRFPHTVYVLSLKRGTIIPCTHQNTVFQTLRLLP